MQMYRLTPSLVLLVPRTALTHWGEARRPCSNRGAVSGPSELRPSVNDARLRVRVMMRVPSYRVARTHSEAQALRVRASCLLSSPLLSSPLRPRAPWEALASFLSSRHSTPELPQTCRGRRIMCTWLAAASGKPLPESRWARAQVPRVIVYFLLEDADRGLGGGWGWRWGWLAFADAAHMHTNVRLSGAAHARSLRGKTHNPHALRL